MVRRERGRRVDGDVIASPGLRRAEPTHEAMTGDQASLDDRVRRGFEGSRPRVMTSSPSLSQ